MNKCTSVCDKILPCFQTPTCTYSYSQINSYCTFIPEHWAVSCSVLGAFTSSDFYHKVTDPSWVGKRNVTLQLLLGIEISTDNSEKRDSYLTSWILSSADSSHFLSAQNCPHAWEEISSARCRQITLFLFFYIDFLKWMYNCHFSYFNSTAF